MIQSILAMKTFYIKAVYMETFNMKTFYMKTFHMQTFDMKTFDSESYKWETKQAQPETKLMNKSKRKRQTLTWLAKTDQYLTQLRTKHQY